MKMKIVEVRGVLSVLSSEITALIRSGSDRCSLGARMTVTTQRSVGMPRATMAALMLAVFTVSVGYGVVLPLLPYLIERLQTRDISGLIGQDVLLLARSEDHYSPDGTVARPDKNAQERALNHGALVYPERERTEPLPRRQIRFGPQNHRQLVGRLRHERRGAIWSNGTPRPCQMTSSWRRSAES